MIKRIIKFLILLTIVICQENTSIRSNKFAAFQLSSERYTTNDDGTILMKVESLSYLLSVGGIMNLRIQKESFLKNQIFRI